MGPSEYLIPKVLMIPCFIFSIISVVSLILSLFKIKIMSVPNDFFSEKILYYSLSTLCN